MNAQCEERLCKLERSNRLWTTATICLCVAIALMGFTRPGLQDAKFDTIEARKIELIHPEAMGSIVLEQTTDGGSIIFRDGGNQKKLLISARSSGSQVIQFGTSAGLSVSDDGRLAGLVGSWGFTNYRLWIGDKALPMFEVSADSHGGLLRLRSAEGEERVSLRSALTPGDDPQETGIIEVNGDSGQTVIQPSPKE